MADNPKRNRQGEIDQLSAYRQQRITGWFLCGVSAAAVTAFVLLLKYHYSIPAGICLAAAAATLMAGRFLLVIYPPEHMDEATRTARLQKLGKLSETWANSLCGILVPAFLMLSSMFMFLFSTGIKPLQAFFAILFLISGVQVNRGHKHPSRIDDRISSMIFSMTPSATTATP